MSEPSESQSLLVKDFVSSCNERIRNQRYRRHSNSGDESGSDEWWDESASSCSSYCCESHSGSFADWENEVSPLGELFYIESLPQTTVQTEFVNAGTKTDALAASENTSTKVQNHSKIKFTKGKLACLIRRRNSRRSVRKKTSDCATGKTQNTEQTEVPNIPNNNKNAGSKVTFRDSQEGECREVKLNIEVDSNNLGRRATLSEALLGLVVSTFAPVDQSRVMIAGFIPNGQSIKHRNIKIGDWLRCVNGEEVNMQTIDSVLAKINVPSEVMLKLQRVAGCDIAELPQQSNNSKSNVEQSDQVRQLVGGYTDSSHLHGLPIGIVYIKQDLITEGGPPDQDLIYCYPPPSEQNVVYMARGSFITLNHLMPDLAPSPVISTSVYLHSHLAHIIYTSEGNELFLLVVPDSRCSLREAIQLNTDMLRSLRFSYQSLSRCFTNDENKIALDRFFTLFFTRLIKQPDPVMSSPKFENILPAAHWIPLPRDAQVQIDDALSELESNDFGGYGEDSNCYQRLYSVIGSCLFHKGYLLNSHLFQEDLLDINAYCRHYGLQDLSRTEPLKSLVIWREVYPASCNRGLPCPQNTLYIIPEGRWFLLIVGQDQDLLVLLLESGGCTVKAVGNPGPDVLYVEQAQATLQHIKDIGVLAVADKWITSNPRPQVVCPESPTKVSTKSTPETVSPASKHSEPSPKAHSVSSSGSKKTSEVTSILKHRHSPDSSLFSSTLSGQYETSEDSASQATSSVISDEALPILGRRAERERASASDTNSHSRLTDSDLSDDSDWAPYKEHSRVLHGSRAYDLSELGKGLLSDYIVPSRLTAGEENVLFHYVQLDCAEGVLLCPPIQVQSLRLQNVLDNFRSTAQLIHNLLQNTVRFKKLKAQEVCDSLINKSLIAIKEYGMLFESPPLDSESTKKLTPLTHWVIGRLFFVPHPREVYICYQDSAPQNMVEIAFRLALSASG